MQSRSYDNLVAGVDEAGRGPLAGAVYAAAVILKKAEPIAGLRDSKLLSPARRRQLAQQIKEKALAWAIGRAEVAEIEALNILQASLLAMQRALQRLAIQPDKALIDGNRVPSLSYPAQALIKGDQKIAAISAASILAKEARDEYMRSLDKDYPGYGFARNKGYPTPAHRLALKRLGVTPVHRRNFSPVKELLSL